MASLLESVTGLLGQGDTMNLIGRTLGTGKANTTSAVDAAVPALLGGLADKSAEPGGTAALSGMLNDQDDSMLDNLGGFIGGDHSGGSSVLNSVFGDKRGALESGLARESGLGSGIITKLLPMLAPIVMGVVKRRAASDNLDEAGLGKLLSGEKSGLMSGGHGKLLGLMGGGAAAAGAVGAAGMAAKGKAADVASASTGKVTSTSTGKVTSANTGKVTSASGGKVSSVSSTGDGKVAKTTSTQKVTKTTGQTTRKATAGGETATTTRVTRTEPQVKGGLPKWLWPLLGLLLLVGLLALLLTQCNNDDDNLDTSTAAPASTAAPTTAAPTTAAPTTAAPTTEAPTTTAAPTTTTTEAAVEVVPDVNSALTGAGIAGATASGTAGAIVLTGTVDSEETKAAAEETANGVDGVTSVDNRLQVEAAAGNTIADVIAGEDNLSSLAAAVEAAGQTDTLRTAGPLTVFAPSNEALARAGITDPADVPEATLLYHVVAGENLSTDLTTGVIKSTNALDLNIETGDGVTVNGIPVVAADLTADNGVVHIIDGVLTPPRATLNEAIGLEAITFNTNSAVITPESQTELLDKAVPYFTENADVNFEIAGHTDSDGGDAANQTLSEARSASVQAFLVENGIDAGRITTTGFGESQPKVSNATPEGKATNRRIDFHAAG